MDKFNAIISIEVFCNCGAKLDVNMLDETPFAYATARITPCGRCWQEAYQEGQEEGKEEGYAKHEEEMKDGDA
jgi:hypothetical protein